MLRMTAGTQLLTIPGPSGRIDVAIDLPAGRATGVAVIGGTLGSLGLVLRRRWATGLLVASLLGVLAQDVALATLLDDLKAAGGLAPLLEGRA